MKFDTEHNQRQQSPESAATDNAVSLYLGDALVKLRKILHGDDRMMRDSMDEIRAKDAASNCAMNYSECMRLIDEPMTEDQTKRAQDLFQRKIDVRRKVVDALGLSEFWDADFAEVQSRAKIRQAAAVLAHLRIIGPPPGVRRA